MSYASPGAVWQRSDVANPFRAEAAIFGAVKPLGADG